MARIAKVISLLEGKEHQALKAAADILLLGGVVAVPTDTIYGIAALSQNVKAINRVYDIKRRNLCKPIAISVGEVDDIYRWSNVTVDRLCLTELLPGPVTVVMKRKTELNPQLNPDTDLIGIRIPDHNFIRKLAQLCNQPIALTSANVSSDRSTLSVQEFEELWPKLDLIIDGGTLGHSSSRRLGSTVVDLSLKGKYQIIRPGSGFDSTVEILNRYNITEQFS